MKLIKLIIYCVLTYTGVVFMLRWINQKLFGNQITILYTHRVVEKSDKLYSFLKILDYFTVDEFENRIKYLKKHYKFITLHQAVEYIKAEDIPLNCIVLTFDDGYKCNFTRIFPILLKYNIPATIFITTSSINNESVLWHDRLITAMEQTKEQELVIPELKDKVYKIESLNKKKKAYEEICQLLKDKEDIKKKEILDEIIKNLKVDDKTFYECNPMLNWDEVKEMKDSGLIDIGSHTINHPILTRVSLEQAKREIMQSKNDIEQYIGKEVKYFSYPNGDYNFKLKEVVKSAGYEAAFTVDSNLVNKKFNTYYLSRKGFSYEEFSFFAVRMAGIIDYFKQLSGKTEKLHPWLISYGAGRIMKKASLKYKGLKHVFLLICDHYEPLGTAADEQTGLQRLEKWCRRYPEIADKYTDSNGVKPKYTFFYPEEEYRHEYLEMLSDLCRRGYGEVEVHLHHHNDTEDNLRTTLLDFKNNLSNKYGLLSKDKQTKEIKYGFIHGNWALSNSRRDGRLCGVDNELEILQETGCYADFTMPSAPDPTQTRKINSIYYPTGTYDQLKPHDFGVNAEKGKNNRSGLLMAQGPLMLNWKKRKLGLIPHIENGIIGEEDIITEQRIKLWVNADIHIKNKPEFIFIKLYTHGCQENNMNYLLGDGLEQLFSLLQSRYNDKNGYKLHYITSREMVNIIKAVEDNVDTADITSIKDHRLLKAWA